MSSSTIQTLVFLAKSAVVGLALAFVAVALKPELLVRQPAPLMSLADAVERSAPSVVSIYSANAVGGTGVRQATSLGSGVIVTADGYVVTNEHVVQGAGDLFVSLQNGDVAAATLIGTDPDTDLALLTINPAQVSAPLPAMPLGDSTGVRTGDIVIAIGNPFGIGQTVTQGIVSATGRSQLGLNSFEDFVQTDAAINPGNSGGALVNASGELVGINTAVVTGRGSEGISFAIPVNLVKGVVAQLIENGRVIRGWLGVTAESLSPVETSFFGVNGGIVLKQVYPNTPAALAGLRVGDIIIAINDEPVAQLKDALHRVARTEPGTRIELSGVSRSRERFETVATIIERPPPPRTAARGG
ncbi:MAG: trypsin-like peptidase domain-containing protein [Pseudomonadota bacterium]